MKNNILFGAFTILLMVAIVLFSVQTVTAQKKNEIQIDRQGYEQLEDEYTQAVREILNAWYIPNAGISMTKVIYEDGVREYTVTIHHERINKLSPQKRTELKAELEKLVFPLPECKVFHDFLNCEA